MARTGRNENKSGSKWTTIALDRDFKAEIEKQMDYGDSFQSFLQEQLEINNGE